MSSNKQQFRDKDIIFREGDPATRAFTIIAGKVELVTEVDGQEKHLGLLGPGKTLGDADITRGRHQATAIAAGTVTLRALDQQALALVTPPPPRPGLLARLLGPLAAADGDGNRRRFSLFGWFRQIKEASQPADPSRIEIRVAPLVADITEPESAGPDGLPSADQILVDAFAGLEGVRARALKKPVTIAEDPPPADRFNRLHWAARQALAQAEADLLIGFETDPAGQKLSLKFLPLGVQNEDPPGLSHPAQSLTLPAQPDEALAALTVAVSLATTVPLTDVKKGRLAQLLPDAVERAAPAVEALATAPGLSERDKTVARLFFANLLTQVSAPAGQLEGYRTAADLYGQAIGALTEETDALDRAVAQRALGAILPVLAPEWETLEMPGDGEDEEKAAGPLAQATALLEGAAEHFTREAHPKEWAALQNRLGHLCYRIDAQEGDQELLKKSLNHYQAALQVFNRVDHPMRWAEVMNNIGQAAAILGEQLKSVELFEKAIEACSSALEVRHKLDHPILWAATQNNLGSALFMLAKQTHDPAQLEAAREAFALAKGVYEARGAHRLTMITEKNLSRVERLMEIARPKSPPPLPWEPKEYASHLAEPPGNSPLDDDDEEGDMGVYDVPTEDDDDTPPGLKARTAGAR